MSKHTPTPWKYKNSDWGGYDIINTKDNKIGFVDKEINAAFIVKAVNNFDELVEACRQAIAGLKEKHLEDYEREDLINFIEERLKNATEGKQ